MHVTKTKAVRVSLLPDVVLREAFAEASRFRGEFYECLTARRDELFELTDAVPCADGAVKSPVDLTLLPEHRRGHGAMYGGLNHGRIDVDRMRALLAGLSLPRSHGGRLVLAVDVSPWLRSDAPCSAERLFCHVYGRAKTACSSSRAGPTPSWPFWSRAPRPGPRSWTRSGWDRLTTRRGHRRPAPGCRRATHRRWSVAGRGPAYRDRHRCWLRRHPPCLGPA
ncbi:transposase [Streptomyces decoyicus]|uniref:transposase n=1 Tax=Streptomyces decoyicus TaxID=249567 RepID=UPI00362B3822